MEKLYLEDVMECIRVVDPLTGNQKDTINIGVYIAASPALAR